MKNFKTTAVIFIAILVVLVVFDTTIGVGLYWYVLWAFLWFSVLSIASFSMAWGFYLKPINSNKETADKKIAITFDDGPHPEYTLKVLEILESYQAKATFFCIGYHIESYPEIVKAIVDQGHEVGNHSFSHDILIDSNSVESWLDEIKLADNSILKATGKKSELFRPPFGVTTPKLARALEITEHQVIGWNIRSFDTVIRNPKLVVKRIFKRLKPGSIILLHDTQANVIPVLEHLLQSLQEQNYQTVTINDLIYEK